MRSQASDEQLTLFDRLNAFGNLPRFLKLVWQTSHWLTITNIALRLCLAFLPTAMLYIGKMVIDEVIAIRHHDRVSNDDLWYLIAIEFVLVVLLASLNKVVTLVDTMLGELFANYSSIQILKHAATLDLDQFENAAFYDKLERARQQAQSRAGLLTQVLSQLQDFITMGFLGVGLIMFNPWFTLILVFSTIPSFLGEYYFNARNYELSRSQIHRRRELEYLKSIGASNETAKEVRLFNLSQFIIDRYVTIFRQLFRDNRALGIKRSVWGTILNIIGTAGYYLALLYIIKRVLTGELSIGDLTFMLGAIRQLAGVLQNVIKRFTLVSQGTIFLRDYFDFFKIVPRIAEHPNARPFPKVIQQGFTFENVGFKYTNSNRWASRNLNFTLKPGEKLALVGENGAGKTTLVKLLVRLYDPTEGRILLDGHDLREYKLSDLRQGIGIIFQDYLRYQMTASENIAVGNIKEINNLKLIKHAARQSLASTIIEKLPQKYDQMLGRYFNNGVDLSGGEWQKVALARAYMRDAQVMILDEPTAALDARSEYEVFERFSDLTKDKTAMLISHRFSTVRMADRILVLDKGEILEAGTHEELLKMEGRYAELFELQAMGYR